jgi:hypothetical protein
VTGRIGFKFVFAVVSALLLVTLTAEAAIQGVLTKKKVNEFQASAGRSGSNRYLAWTQSPAARISRTKVMARRNGNTFRVNRKGTRAYTGGISGDTLLYQEIRPRRSASNIFGFNLKSKNRSAYGAINTKWWEYGPTKSGPWVLFSRDTNRTRRVILINLKTKNSRILAKVRNKGVRQARAGQVNGPWAVYHTCTRNGCEVFRYNIQTKNKIRLPSPRFAQYFASVARDGDVYYVVSGRGFCSNVRLLRWRSGNATQVAYLGNRDSYPTFVGPAPGAKVDVYFSKYRCNKRGTNIARRPRANVYKTRVN